MNDGHARIQNAVIDRYLAVVGPSAWAVYTVLRRYANAENECWPSVATIEDLTGLCRPVIAKSFKALESNGLISIEIRPGKNSLYRLLPPKDSLGGKESSPPKENEQESPKKVNTLPPKKIGGAPPKESLHEQDLIQQDLSEQDLNNKYQPTPTASVGCATTDLVLATPGTATPTAREATRGTSRSNGNAVNIGDTGGGAANSTPVWEAYAQGYRAKYGVPPIRNAAVNKMLLTMIGRIGLENAIGVAGWFPSHRNSWYVTKGHSVQVMLGDCEKLRTEWLRGRMTTQQEAREEDRLAGMGQMWAEIAAERRLKNGS